MQSDAAEHERGLAEFMSKARRTRFFAAMSKGGKARLKETARLHNGPDLDERWVRPPFEPAAGEEHLRQILRAVLAEAPKASHAYVVSGDRHLDGRVLELAEALEAATWATEGSLLSVIPGRVAVYMGELADSARLLVRRAGPLAPHRDTQGVAITESDDDLVPVLVDARPSGQTRIERACHSRCATRSRIGWCANRRRLPGASPVLTPLRGRLATGNRSGDKSPRER